MKITNALLRQQAEEAFAAVWWLRTDPDDPSPDVQQAIARVRAAHPRIVGVIARDAVTLCRWEGRLATLRDLAYGDGTEPWDGEGAFDS